jgi:membrane protein DedA with SNARE-associated domain
MIAHIFSLVANFILGIINQTGYLGVFILMALESCNVPIPSEVVMPFSGFLVHQKIFSLVVLAVIGALGNLFGSLVSYFIAFKLKDGVKRFFEKSKFFYHDYVKAENFFNRYGEKSALIARVLPIVRTYISFPAGVFKVNLLKFSIYTFLGSLVWSYFLAYLGFYLGENWQILESYFRRFDYLILIVIVGFLCYYIFRKIKEVKSRR